MRKGLVFSFYFISYAGSAFLFPFLILYYQRLGLSGAQIGVLAGIGPLLNLLGASFWTGLADAIRRHRLVMTMALISMVVLTPLFTVMQSFIQVLLLMVAFCVLASPVNPLADSATLAVLGPEKAQYGRIRLGGTLGWGVMAPFAGVLVQRFGLDLAFWSFAGLTLLSLLASQAFIFPPASGPAIDLRGGVRTLLANPRWKLFLVVALVSGMGMMSINSYLFSYLGELQVKEGLMGVASMLPTVLELPVFFFGGRLLKRFKPYTLLVAAVTLLGVRLLLFYLLDFPAGVISFQLLNGLVFPVLWIAGVSYSDAYAPPGLKATAQGVFHGTVFGLGAALGGAIGGPLLASLGGGGMYLVFGLVVLGSLALLTTLERRLPVEAVG